VGEVEFPGLGFCGRVSRGFESQSDRLDLKACTMTALAVPGTTCMSRLSSLHSRRKSNTSAVERARPALPACFSAGPPEIHDGCSRLALL